MHKAKRKLYGAIKMLNEYSLKNVENEKPDEVEAVLYALIAKECREFLAAYEKFLPQGAMSEAQIFDALKDIEEKTTEVIK